MRLLSMLVAGALVSGVAGAAQASTASVTTAVKSQDRVVKHSVAYRSLKNIDRVRTRSQARVLIRRDARLQLLLRHAATVVSRATVSDARQRTGRRDWVIGVRDLARGVGQLDGGFRQLLDGRSLAARRDLLRAKHTLRVADAIGTRGDRLLGIPPNY
jgi:hypothetical protein